MKKLSSKRWARVAGLGAVALAMALDTSYVSGEEAAVIDGPSFIAAEFVATEFDAVVGLIEADAIDAAELLPAILEDPEAAAARYALDVSGKSVYPIVAQGTVIEVDDRFAILSIDGVPSEASVRFPIGDAVSGSPVRDVTGTMTFGDFPGQTEFQSVANEFKLLIISDVLGVLDVDALPESTVTVLGAWSSGGPAGTFVIQPVRIEVTS